MHELGLIAEIVDSIEKVAAENNVKQIDTLVLDVGEYSGVVPQYLEECYPAVIEGTLLEHTKLKMNIIPGQAICNDCKEVFPIKGNEQHCPDCGSQDCDVIDGAQFMIREIVVPDYEPIDDGDDDSNESDDSE